MLVYFYQPDDAGTRNSKYVAEAIVCAQAKFFAGSHDPALLVPLTMADLARTLNIHVSQISRAIAGVSISTPHGREYPLKFFFDRGSAVPVDIKHERGQERGQGRVRHESIKQRIKVMMKLHQNITDAEMAARLASDGIKIARRTVTKYRHAIQK